MKGLILVKQTWPYFDSLCSFTISETSVHKEIISYYIKWYDYQWLQKFIAPFGIEVMVTRKLFELRLKQSKLYDCDFKSNIELILCSQHRQSFLASS